MIWYRVFYLPKNRNLDNQYTVFKVLFTFELHCGERLTHYLNELFLVYHNILWLSSIQKLINYRSLLCLDRLLLRFYFVILILSLFIVIVKNFLFYFYVSLFCCILLYHNILWLSSIIFSKKYDKITMWIHVWIYFAHYSAKFYQIFVLFKRMTNIYLLTTVFT